MNHNNNFQDDEGKLPQMYLRKKGEVAICKLILSISQKRIRKRMLQKMINFGPFFQSRHVLIQFVPYI